MGRHDVQRLDENRLLLPKGYISGMQSDGMIFVDAALEASLDDKSLRQVAGVATLPGIVGPSMAMPDVHAGYGFVIGGVAAFDAVTGIVSPGGVGYDIN